MTKNWKMIHRKTDVRILFFEYVEFDSVEEALEMFPRIDMCQICFSQQDM